MPADWPKQLKLVGFPLAERPIDDSALQPALRSFLATARESSKPVFAFALGSAPPPYASTYFETAVEACRQLGAKAVLLCTVDGLVPQPLPEHCYHASFAPFSALLQHVAVFSFNGGIGGASEALRAGTPQVRSAFICTAGHGLTDPARSSSRQDASISLTMQSAWCGWASLHASTSPTSVCVGALQRCRSCVPSRRCAPRVLQPQHISRSRCRPAPRWQRSTWLRRCNLCCKMRPSQTAQASAAAAMARCESTRSHAAVERVRGARRGV